MTICPNKEPATQMWVNIKARRSAQILGRGWASAAFSVLLCSEPILEESATLSKGSLLDVHRRQHSGTSFREKKRLYWEVKWQGDRRQGSQICPSIHSLGQKFKFGVRGNRLVCRRTGQAGFSRMALNLAIYGKLWKRALTTDLPGQWTSHCRKGSGFPVPVMSSCPAVLRFCVWRETGSGCYFRSKLSPLHMLQLHDLQFWLAASAR